jgi:hypothetical protein
MAPKASKKADSHKLRRTESEPQSHRSRPVRLLPGPPKPIFDGDGKIVNLPELDRATLEQYRPPPGNKPIRVVPRNDFELLPPGPPVRELMTQGFQAQQGLEQVQAPAPVATNARYSARSRFENMVPHQQHPGYPAPATNDGEFGLEKEFWDLLDDTLGEPSLSSNPVSFSPHVPGPADAPPPISAPEYQHSGFNGPPLDYSSTTPEYGFLGNGFQSNGFQGNDNAGSGYNTPSAAATYAPQYANTQPVIQPGIDPSLQGGSYSQLLSPGFFLQPPGHTSGYPPQYPLPTYAPQFVDNFSLPQMTAQMPPGYPVMQQPQGQTHCPVPGYNPMYAAPLPQQPPLPPLPVPVPGNYQHNTGPTQQPGRQLVPRRRPGRPRRQRIERSAPFPPFVSGTTTPLSVESSASIPIDPLLEDMYSTGNRQPLEGDDAGPPDG